MSAHEIFRCAEAELPSQERAVAKTLKVLCVHGLGDHRVAPWREEWGGAVGKAVSDDAEIALEFHFAGYDHLFEEVNIN